jgi:hypothetical protein
MSQHNDDTLWTRWIPNITYLRFSPDDSLLAASSYYDKKLYLIKTVNGEIDTILQGSQFAEFTYDGKYIVYIEDSLLKVMDAKTYEEIELFEQDDKGFNTMISVSPNNLVAAVYKDKMGFRIWDMTSGKIIDTINYGWTTPGLYKNCVYLTGYTPDGKYLIELIHNVRVDEKGEEFPGSGFISIFDTNLHLVNTFRNSKGFYISKTGKYIASVLYNSPDIGAKVINIETGDEVFNIWPPSSLIWGIDFHPNDDFVAVASYILNGAIDIWNIHYPYTNYGGFSDTSCYYSVRFNNNGNYIAASTKKRIFLYGTPSYISISETDDIINCTIYPNPVTDKLKIKNSNFVNNNKIQILSLEGKVILESEFKEEIDVSSLLTGVYFLRIGNIIKSFIVYR